MASKNAILTDGDGNQLAVATTAEQVMWDETTNLKQNLNVVDAINSINIEYGRINGTSYLLARIPRTTNLGNKLKPKLRLSPVDGTLSGTKRSVLEYATDEKNVLAINCGLFNMSTLVPVGITIIDSQVITNTSTVRYPLCIDSDGNLTMEYSGDTDANTLVSNGVKYASLVWGKLIDNYVSAITSGNTSSAVRQVIGQYQNGDYFVFTADGTRGSVTNETGLTAQQTVNFLLTKGVKTAYDLDGGGSAETVLGKHQINPIYENTTGRKIVTLLYFDVE